MKKINWNRGWKFWKEEDAFALVWNVPEKARELDLPHDAMIEEQAHAGSPNKGNTGFRDGGNYVYVKTLFAAPEDREKTLTLCFDGVYGIAMVYVNEQLAAKNPFGYSRFYVPLGDLLRYGEDNEIRVLVKNAGMTNSRWYSGSGIYRDVELLEGGLCHLLPGKVRICTERIETEYAQVTVEAIIKNRLHYPLEIILETEIFPERAKEAQQKGEKADKEVSSERMPLVLFAGEERRISFSMPVENPRLWSAQDPFLYTCRLRLWEGEVCLDEHAETIGLRTISADTKKGLRINGRTVKLRGACIHHDSGLLGAATYKEAQFRQIARLKKAGFNGIRMAHHPMAEAMLCACDRLGMYVMDEAFDMWTRPKSDMDYALYFSEWWERDITAMVDKDYNHPCVILYSSGNTPSSRTASWV